MGEGVLLCFGDHSGKFETGLRRTLHLGGDLDRGRDT